MAKKFVTPAKYARIRQAASAFILDGAGLVPNQMADFEEPIYGIANDCFGLRAILANVERGLDVIQPETLKEQTNDAFVKAYDTTLIVGYMFGVAVGLQMAGGFASTPTADKGQAQ